jgi:phosphonate transport system ATP-binding protein
VREIYGTDGEGNEISEAITSTSITATPMPAAVVSPSPAMLRTASASA